MRQQAFMAFDLGIRPTDVARMIKLSQTTAFRYFQQWKKMPLLFKAKYKLARRYFRKLGYNDHRAIARILADELSTSEEEVLAQMRKPWAIKQIVTGEWRQWPVKTAGFRRKARLDTWLQILLPLRKTKEVRHILKMATNQNINPFK